MGPMVIDNIRQFYADFAVIGIGGIDKTIGLSVQNISEASVAKAMIERSTKKIVLADPSKFGRRGIAHVAGFHQIDYLVSSEKPSDEICDALAKSNVVLSMP